MHRYRDGVGIEIVMIHLLSALVTTDNSLSVVSNIVAFFPVSDSLRTVSIVNGHPI